MEASWINQLSNWIALNPAWAGVVIFVVSMAESLAFVGIIIPGIVVLFALGALVGLGVIDFVSVWVWASLGALAGDGLSYYLGWRLKSRASATWPFSRYPDLMGRARQFIRRHGDKSILIGRFVGPLRPIVPVVTGVAGMRPARFMAWDIPACILWAPAYLIPGLILGASLELAAEYTVRLATVAAILVGLVWLLSWAMGLAYDFFTRRSGRLLRRAIRWSRNHPRLGKITRGVIDPAQPETLSIAGLGLTLVLLFGLFLLALWQSPLGGDTNAFDQWLSLQANGLRNHLADPFMQALALLSDASVLLVSAGAVALLLILRGNFFALWHWLAAVLGGYGLQQVLAFAVRNAGDGASAPVTYLPSDNLTLMTATLLFLAILVARHHRRRQRRWFYLLAVLLTALSFTANLYLGSEWFSGGIAALMLGGLWAMIVGIGYRQHVGAHRAVRRGRWRRRRAAAKATAVVFYVALLVGMGWSATHQSPATTPLQIASAEKVSMNRHDWFNPGSGLSVAPDNNLIADKRPINLQWLGSLEHIRASLTEAGWRQPPQPTWRWLLASLNPDPDLDTLTLLPRDYLGRPAALTLVQPESTTGDTLLSLRLWQSGQRAGGSEPAPIWFGLLAQEKIEPRLLLFHHWHAEPVPADRVRDLLQPLRAWQVNSGGMDVRIMPATGRPAAIPTSQATAVPVGRWHH